MYAEIQLAAYTEAAIQPNPHLESVMQAYLKGKYLDHKKRFSQKGYKTASYGLGCGCELCRAIDKVTQWTKAVIRYEHTSWRGGWQSASPAYVEAITNLQIAKRERDELKVKLSTYA